MLAVDFADANIGETFLPRMFFRVGPQSYAEVSITYWGLVPLRRENERFAFRPV